MLCRKACLLPRSNFVGFTSIIHQMFNIIHVDFGVEFILHYNPVEHMLTETLTSRSIQLIKFLSVVTIVTADWTYKLERKKGRAA